MNKALITILIIFTACVIGKAQNNINVASFKLDVTDLTANQNGTTVLDQNGEKSALIKIRTTQTGFSFDVATLPALADVAIDGVNKGQTPLVIDMIVGEHQVTVSKSGYGDLNKTVSVTEGQTATVEGTLSHTTKVTISTDNPDANITIDGVDKGRIQNSYDLSFGTHTIKLTWQDFLNLDTVITVSSQHTNFSFAQAEYYRKAAEQGNADAQYNLGVCYDNGEGVTQSYEEAVKWYRLAAEQGNAMAQYNLGGCYEFGEGVTQSYEEAFKWYSKAVLSDNPPKIAYKNLADCYRYGRGTIADYKKAEYYQKKADQYK